MSKILKNLSYNLVYQILVFVLPLITTPYVSRVLGAENIGIFAYTNAIVYNFILFAMLGMSNLGNRSIASVQNKKKERSTIFCNLYCIQFVCFFVALLIYFVYVFTATEEYKVYLYVQALYLVSGMLDISWLYFGLEEFKFTVVRNAIIKIVSVVLIFLLVKSSKDLIVYTIIISVSYLLSQLYLWIPLSKRIEFVTPSFMVMHDYLKPLFILFAPVLAYSIYKVMDKIMLGMFSTMNEVAYYENSLKIVSIPTGIITALGTVMLPRMSALISNDDSKTSKLYMRLSIHFVTLISAGSFFGVLAVGDNLAITYFGNEFVKCGPLMKLLTMTCFFVGWANVGRTQYLIPNKLDKIYVISTAAGAVINLFINLLLIPKMASIGAAIGTIFAEFGVMIIQYLLIRKYINLFVWIRESVGYVIVGIFMGSVVFFLQKALPYGWSSLLVEVVVGAILYYLICYFYIRLNVTKKIKQEF